MTLTKVDIIHELQSEMSLSRRKSAVLVENLLELMKESIQNGEDVLISRFGKFCVKSKNPRRGRNPATGEELILSSRRVVTFKCSLKLRNKINRRQGHA